MMHIDNFRWKQVESRVIKHIIWILIYICIEHATIWMPLLVSADHSYCTQGSDGPGCTSFYPVRVRFSGKFFRSISFSWKCHSPDTHCHIFSAQDHTAIHQEECCCVQGAPQSIRTPGKYARDYTKARDRSI